MTLKSDRELAYTREKLQMLEEDYEALRVDGKADPHDREVTLESLKRLINQLKEQIARYESRLPAHR